MLNLANPVNPGGGVRRGAIAQEENLCRKGSLLLSLESKNALPYYRFNRSLDTYMGSDAVVINPQEMKRTDICEASHDLSRVLPTACLAAGSPFGVRTAFPLYSLGSAVTLPQQ